MITVKRPLDLEQLNIEFLNQATPKSYYNGLLTLKKAGLFASSCEQLIDNALDRMQNKIKQFKSYGTNEDDTESISFTSGNEESNSSSPDERGSIFISKMNSESWTTNTSYFLIILI